MFPRSNNLDVFPYSHSDYMVLAQRLGMQGNTATIFTCCILLASKNITTVNQMALFSVTELCCADEVKMRACEVVVCVKGSIFFLNCCIYLIHIKNRKMLLATSKLKLQMCCY